MRKPKLRKKKVGDKELACSKVTGILTTRFAGAPADKGPESKMKMWLSKDVKGGGLVAMETALKGPKGEVLAV